MPVCQRILGTKLQKGDQQVKTEVWEGVYSPVHQRGDVQEVRKVQVSSRFLWAHMWDKGGEKKEEEKEGEGEKGEGEKGESEREEKAKREENQHS